MLCFLGCAPLDVGKRNFQNYASPQVAKAASPLDWAVGAMGRDDYGNPLMLVSMLARPVTRNALLSACVAYATGGHRAICNYSRFDAPEPAFDPAFSPTNF